MGDFDHATKCYEVALDLSPTGEHYNNLGYNLVLKGEYDEAVEVLKTAAALEPQNDKIRNNLALAHSNKGSHDFALGEIQKTGDPDGNRLALAEALLKTGKALGASELVAQAARLDPIFEQKLSEKDQFVIRMTRTLKEQEDTKIVTAQEVKRLVTTVNVTKRADKETIKIVRKASVGAKKLKAQAVKSETDSAAIYPPDFMFNKRQVNVITGATEERKPKINQEPTVQFIGELFPIRYASGRDTAEHTPRTLSF
jgi:tetratricopeptide (TPR) repeat protein